MCVQERCQNCALRCVSVRVDGRKPDAFETGLAALLGLALRNTRRTSSSLVRGHDLHLPAPKPRRVCYASAHDLAKSRGSRNEFFDIFFWFLRDVSFLIAIHRATHYFHSIPYHESLTISVFSQGTLGYLKSWFVTWPLCASR